MARGHRWAQEQVRQWVEAWWDSGFTSAEFVESQNLAIAPRSLREHGQRLFAEVREELKRLQVSEAPAEVRLTATVTSLPESLAEPVAATPVAPCRMATPATECGHLGADRRRFDFSDGEPE